MGTANYLGAEWHGLILNADAIPNIADDAATAPLTNLYAALHTADPGVSGDQTTSEATYTSYARVAVARDGTGWTVSNLVATLQNNIDFAEATGGTESLTHFSIGTDSTGAGNLLYTGEIKDSGGTAAPISVSTGTIPRISSGSTITLS